MVPKEMIETQAEVIIKQTNSIPSVSNLKRVLMFCILEICAYLSIEIITRFNNSRNICFKCSVIIVVFRIFLK